MGSYTVTVGAGGMGGGNHAGGNDGNASTFVNITAGGGGGGVQNFYNGRTGGCGSGGSLPGGYFGAAGTQGGRGADPGTWPTGRDCDGGGGGMGGDAPATTVSQIADGGPPKTFTLAGVTLTVAGGGGGACNWNGSTGFAGNGGGGIGGSGGAGNGNLKSTDCICATAGAPNTGSGGGGACCWFVSPCDSGGAGGTGIIVVAFSGGTMTPPGSYCSGSGSSIAGAQCIAGFYCTGGTSSPLACTCMVGSWCAAGATSASASCTACPGGLYCAGGMALPVVHQCTTTLNGYGFNMTSLMKTSTPGWSFNTGNQYYYNFCGDIPDGGSCMDPGMNGQGAAMCQFGGSFQKNCGLSSTKVWSLLNTSSPCSGLVYAVAGGNGGRNTVISVTCDTTVTSLAFTSYLENPSGRYNIRVRSKFACCTTCLPGQFLAVWVCSPCTCSSGWASSTTTSSGCATTTGTCSPCMAGYLCAGAATQPAPCTCSAGYASTAITSIACATTSSTCSSTGCGAGSVCAGGSAQPDTCTCSPGYVSTSATTNACAGSTSTCAACGLGLKCAGAAAQPVACACNAGYYSPAGATTTCTGTTGSCTTCTAGNYCSGASAAPVACTCSPCYASTSTSSTACNGTAASCTPCPAGAYCVGVAAPPVPCSPGFISRSQESVCSPCQPGRYAGGNGSTACAACPLGGFTELYGSASCAPCAYGGGGITGGVACEAPSGIAVRGGGACTVQPTRDVACWGARWQAPFVLWAADARARGGRSFIVGAAGVCLGDAFVGVLLVNGTIIVVSGDLGNNATSIAFAQGTRFELIWCGPRHLCARTASGELVCGTRPATALGGASSVVIALQWIPLIQNSTLTAVIGEDHVCALAANGSVTCFNATVPALPLPAPPGIFLHIAADGAVTCGIRAADRSVACWSVDGGGTTLPGNTPAPMKSVCVGGAGAVCGLAWSPPPGITSDTMYTRTEHEMCWNATTGAVLPGVIAENETFRSISCSAGGTCGITGNWSAVCDSVALRPVCGAGNNAANTPNSCVGIAAVAVDAGGAPGVGAGDLVEVTLSRAAGQCANGNDVSDGGTFYSPLQFAGAGSCPAGVSCMNASTLMGGGVTWNAAITAFVYVVGNVRGPIGSTEFEVGIDVTRIGALAFDVNTTEHCAGGNLQGALPVLVTGSWGPQPAPRVLNATARDGTGAAPGLSVGDTLLVTFDSETSRPPHLNAHILSGYLGEVRFEWVDTRTLAITVTHPFAAAATREVQIGVLRLIISPGDGIVSRDLSSLPCVAKNLFVNGSWGNSIISVISPSLDALTSAGGDSLVLQLAATIGAHAVASDVKVEYANGQWTLAAAQCKPLPAGDTLTCVTVEGVGRNYHFVVWAYGTLIARGGPNASYASPVVTGVSPTLVSTDYPGTLVITGREFGSASVNAVSNVEFSTAGGPTAAAEVFGGLACAVNVSHTTITCGLPPVRGSTLQIQFSIGGQSTSLASLQTLPPSLRAVTLSVSATCGGGGSSMCTRGSAGHVAAVLQGDNFGPVGASGLAVTCSPDAEGATVFTLSGCRVAVAHVTITCDTLPPGYGAPLWFAVVVLGVRSVPLNTSIGYAAPSIARVIGTAPTAGAPLIIVGTDFCTTFAAIVRVQLSGGVPFIPDALNAYPGNTTLDEIVISMPPGVGSNHTVAVSVWGRASPPLAVAYARPVVASVALSAINGLARYCVRVTGSNFGTRVADVVVTLGAAPCTLVEGLLFDSRLDCWTNGVSGNVSIAVARQTALVLPFFDCTSNEPDPLISSMTGLGPLPLAGSGVLAVSGTVVPAAPSTACIMHIADGTAPGHGVAELCALARALSTSFVCSNWCTALSVAHGSSLQCTTPSAALASAQLVVVAVALLNCGVSDPATMRYDPPIVTGITPRLLPTLGGIAMAIAGRNFEANTSFAIAFAVGLAGLSLTAPCVPINASRVLVYCASPRGAGAPARLRMSSSTWTTTSLDVVGFGYRAPVISSVSPRLAHARGGSVINITGSDFSATPQVYLGALLVDIAWQYQHSVISVVVPPGVGAGINVTLIAGGGQSFTQPRALSYVPPAVTGINVSYIDAVSGGLLRVMGAQFGPPGTGAAPAAVTIEDVLCQNARVLSDGVLECAAPARLIVADAAPILVTVGQQQSVAMPVRIACRPGYFGAAGERCSVCPGGAVCGGLQYDPVPAAGYFRVGRASFVACVPSVACMALLPATVAAALAAGTDPAVAYSNCAPGATGDLCAACASQWYRKPNLPACAECPKYASLYIGLFFLFLVTVASFMFYIHQKHMNLKGITIGVDLFQLLSMFHAFQFPWPTSIATLFEVASMSTASIDVAAPQCTINLTYADKWIASQALPVFLMSVLLFGVTMAMLLRACRSVVVGWRRQVRNAVTRGTGMSFVTILGRVWKDFVSGLGEASDFIVGTMFTVMYFTYIITLSRSMEVFSCTHDAAANTWTLNADPGIKCWDGGVQSQLVPFAVVTFVLYGAGDPLLFGYVFKRHGAAIKRDQALWIVGFGNSLETNEDYGVRRRYARLYQDFSPKYFYWRLVLIGRKVLFLSVAQFAKGNPMFQTSLAITIIAVAYALHAMLMPFVSPLEQHALVLGRAQQLLQRGGASDTEQANTDPAARASAARTVQTQARKHRRSSIVALAAATGGTLAHITDFNVLESVLLMTCFGVLLGGAVFKSAVFQTGDAMDWALTVVIFSVLLAAFGVFVWMIVLELRRAFAAAAASEKAVEAQRVRAESAASRSAFKLRNRFSLATAIGRVRKASTAAFGARRSGAAASERMRGGADGPQNTTVVVAASGNGSGGTSGGSSTWPSWRAGSGSAGIATDANAEEFTMIRMRGPGISAATTAATAAAAAAATDTSEAVVVATRNPILSGGGGSFRARVWSMDARRGRPEAKGAFASRDVKGVGGNGSAE